MSMFTKTLHAFAILAMSLHSMNFPGVGGQSATATGLQIHFQQLHSLYTNAANVYGDCKLASSSDRYDIDHHIHWGTKESLEFLAGRRTRRKMSAAEVLMQDHLEKLRVFLSRIGYLADPGSLVFIDKQELTMHLSGCKTDSFWRQHGDESSDEDFQKKGFIGNGLRLHAPDPFAYIHKFMCFNTGSSRCSHTFYVITKLLPDVPLGLQIREGVSSSDEDAFTCGVPFCSIKTCEQGSMSFPRKSFPPYEIQWTVPASVKNAIGIGDVKKPGALNTQDFPTARIKFEWNMKRKTSREKMKYEKEVVAGNPELLSWFGDQMPPLPMSAFSSSIKLTEAEESLHSGNYECVIIDGNGVASTPNIVPNKRNFEYTGDANIHVMPKWQLFSYIVAVVMCVLVALIIIICPKKMEHDDGTLYTKDELKAPVSPEEHDESQRVEVRTSLEVKADSSATSKHTVKSKHSAGE